MTAQQLKNSILQMAVQGKLVPQDPNDEPASVLLERIRAEKERLIKEKKIKREKNPSVIFKGADNTPYEKIGDEVRSLADEVPFDIPDSWEWVRIRSLGEIVRGSGIKRNETVPQGCPCVRYGELYTTYQTSFTSAASFISAELDEKCKHFSYGDVLMTLTGENKPDIAKAAAYLGITPIAAGGDLAFWTQHGMNPLFLSYIMASPYIISRIVFSERFVPLKCLSNSSIIVKDLLSLCYYTVSLLQPFDERKQFLYPLDNAVLLGKRWNRNQFNP